MTLAWLRRFPPRLDRRRRDGISIGTVLVSRQEMKRALVGMGITEIRSIYEAARIFHTLPSSIGKISFGERSGVP